MVAMFEYTFTSNYRAIIEEIKIFCNSGVLKTWWLGYSKDNLPELVAEISQELQPYNLIERKLDPTTVSNSDPYSSLWTVFTSDTNCLADNGVETAILLYLVENPPNSDIFFQSLIGGIDPYFERINVKRRYPIILLTPNRTIERFYSMGIGLDVDGFIDRMEPRILKR